mmetsp:Transcript_120333/g.275621  ORF Transcript_120333/g.275621 Transcript_120333/m.275621 type:complete len:220 (+) Transcript_120333:265-924(+)
MRATRASTPKALPPRAEAAMATRVMSRAAHAPRTWHPINPLLCARGVRGINHSTASAPAYASGTTTITAHKITSENPIATFSSHVVSIGPGTACTSSLSMVYTSPVGVPEVTRSPPKMPPHSLWNDRTKRPPTTQAPQQTRAATTATRASREASATSHNGTSSCSPPHPGATIPAAAFSCTSTSPVPRPPPAAKSPDPCRTLEDSAVDPNEDRRDWASD